MTRLALINPENVSEDEVQTYRVRTAARAVVMDETGAVALLFVSKEKYYKLPGGGIEEGEERLEALRRECREELGCETAVMGEIGSVEERRRHKTLRQISYCYAARVVGEKGTPAFTESESADGFAVVWLPYEEAVQTLRASETVEFSKGAYIVERDLAQLRAAEPFLKSWKAKPPMEGR
jgi:ADP-ribose pyrophosphatase YjhB (NUDIX family)